MSDDNFEERIKALSFSSGKNRMSIEEIARIQPGLARLMPEVGVRTWKLFYAAKAQNWPLARFQCKEIRGLMKLGAFMRPKHEEALNRFLEENWRPIEATLRQGNFPAFEEAFHRAVAAANTYHEVTGKPYIYWKLPDTPPPDLDLSPRPAKK